MVVSQLLIVLAIFLMATVNPVSEDVLIYMAGAAVLLGFSSATQDIVIDAYRIELAPPSMQSILSSIYVSGYRIGMIVAGAGALYLADYFGSTEAFYSYEAWRNTYYIMAGVMTLGILTTFASYEPTAEILQSNKQHRNLKVFLIYSALLLIPGLWFGVIYLLNMLINLALDTPVALIPQVALPSIKFYFLALVACAPLLLLYFIINQPKIINKAPLVAETREDYVRLVLLFVFAVVAFIAAYVLTGQLLPAFDGVFVSFVSETLHLLMSLAVALVAGFALVQAGLVNKQIAMATWIEPIVDFFRRYGMKALLLLALIGLYRISDIVAGVISNVFYQDTLRKTDIANAVKLVGVIMAIAGGFLGGLLAQRFRIMRAVMIGAILACVTNLLFVF